MALWTKLQWTRWAHKVYDKAEDVWQSKWLLVTHLFSLVCLNSPTLTSQMAWDYLQTLCTRHDEAESAILVAWIVALGMLSEHANCHCNMMSSHPFHAYIIYIPVQALYPIKYLLTFSLSSQVLHFLFVLNSTQKWKSSKNGEVLGSFACEKSHLARSICEFLTDQAE